MWKEKNYLFPKETNHWYFGVLCLFKYISFMFVLATRKQRFVVNYEQDRLVYVGCRNLETLQLNTDFQPLVS